MAAIKDDYAKQLSGLKKSYMGATTDPERDAFSKQGLQVRSQANSAGIDLNELENSANQMGGFQVDAAADAPFREQVFSQVKNAPAYNAPAEKTSSGATQTPVRFQNQYMEEANKMMVQLKQMMQQPVSFNPATDPTFMAAQQLSREGAKSATQGTLETMNDRGIINSSITSNQLGQIEQRAELEPLKLIPQLQQNAATQRQQQFANLSGLMGTELNTGLDQQKFAAQLPMQEAAITGKYLPGEAKGLIDQLVQLKTTAEHPFTTQDQLGQYKNQADDLRSQLSTYGIDANKLFGSEVDASVAASNVPQAGQLTQNSQNSLVNLLMGLSNQYGSAQPGTGEQIGKMPLFNELGQTISGLEGKPTSAQQNMDFNQGMESRQFDLTQEKFAFDMQDKKNADAIQWANHNLSAARQTQDQTKLKNDDNSKKATNGYLTQLLSLDSREAAMSYIVDNAPDIISDNANIDSILGSIDAKWPKPKAESAATDNSKDTFTLNKTAAEMAQKDLRWFKARDKASQNAIIKEYKDRLTSQ